MSLQSAAGGRSGTPKLDQVVSISHDAGIAVMELALPGSGADVC